MQLSVIIVNYNVKYYLQQSLYSLEKALGGLDAEVIVFDNHSKDGSVEYLSALFPKVTFISSNHNLGFARANNHAILQSNGKYVLLLNPDTIVGEDTLLDAVNFMENHPKAGALGVRMTNPCGTDARESRRGIPTPLTAFYKMSGLCAHFPNNHKLGKYYMGWLPWDEPARIEIVSGAFCMLRHEAIDKVGLLDEDFFMYGEDIDLSYRILKGGWENWYLPDRILHYKGESTQKSSFRYVHVFYEAMLIFFRKHYSHLSFLITIPVSIAIYAKAASSLLGMLMYKAKQGLGFVSIEKPNDSLYVFYVNPTNMQACQRLAKRKGLWAEFHDANKELNGFEVSPKKNQRIFITYDASTYSYDEMFDKMKQNKDDSISLGIYYPDKELIITQSEIIK